MHEDQVCIAPARRFESLTRALSYHANFDAASLCEGRQEAIK
jgi:hypothetical protein